MKDVQADLRSYYEVEAQQRLRRPPRGRRVELRTAFLELLAVEKCQSVVDFGAGPGGDGQAFIDAGHRYLGVDLAHGNGVLAADADITVVQGSITAPPVRPNSFDAGWSMSTLMHIPEAEVADTLAAMAVPLRPGALLNVGLWGDMKREDVISDTTIEGERRLFSLRTFDRNRELMATIGTIEHAEEWDVASDIWDYHVFRVRVLP